MVEIEFPREGKVPDLPGHLIAVDILHAAAADEVQRPVGQQPVQAVPVIRRLQMLLDSVHQLCQPFFLRCDRLYDGDFMSGLGKHQPQIAEKEVRIGPGSLIHHKNVPDLHQAGRHGLDLVTCCGNQHHQCGIGERGDLDLILTDAYRLHENMIKATGL